MSGYTAAFGSMFHGSLCGQWPALPVFCTLLPLADKNGDIDYSFAYISSVTGWPEDLLRRGIEQLEQPDPGSRSAADDGRRLTRLRDNTDWGWRLVNHGLYREKARKMAFDAARVADGRNAERMRTRRDPTRPDATRADPPSNANAYSNAEEETLRSSSFKTVKSSSSERPQPDVLQKRQARRRAVADAVRDVGRLP